MSGFYLLSWSKPTSISLPTPMPLPVWLQLGGWNFQLERAHSEICSWPDDLVRRREKVGFLEECLGGGTTFFPKGKWRINSLLSFLLLFLSLTFFFFAIFELSHFKALDADLCVYSPFAFNLIPVCCVWLTRGGAEWLSCHSWSSAPPCLAIHWTSSFMTTR